MMPKRRARVLRTVGWLAVASMLATAVLGPAAGTAFATDGSQPATAETTTAPTGMPSEQPSEKPSEQPSKAPSATPSEAPSATPSEAPSATPSEAPSATPSKAPGQAKVYVVKIVDQDGNPATDEDETFPGGWHYLVTVKGGTADPKELVTDEDILAFTTITLDDGSATVSLQEVVQAGYNLLDAICIQEPASEVDLRQLRAARLKIMQDDGIGKLVGNTLTFEVPADTVTLCGFLNQPKKATPSGGVEGATGTPKLTPPSTDAFGAGATSAPANDTWRLMLIAMAGLLATILVLTPATKKARKE